MEVLLRWSNVCAAEHAMRIASTGMRTCVPARVRKRVPAQCLATNNHC